MVRSRPTLAPLAVSISHAAELLDCSRQHVYDLVDRGTLTRVNIPGSTAIRIPTTDIYAALGIESGDAG